MFETISVWALCYGGFPPGKVAEFYQKDPRTVGHVLISPEGLDGCHVVAWMNDEVGISRMKGAMADGPATAIFWLAGYSDLEPVEFWKENRVSEQGYYCVFDGVAEFENGTLYLRGDTSGRFLDITEACFFLVREQVDEDNQHLITNDSYPVVVEVESEDSEE